MTAKPLALFALAVLSSVAGAQTWIRSYENGLSAARSGKWVEAREAFQKAIDARPDDRSLPTVLPGPATERRVWRNDSPYSPNFLAAYPLYRQSRKTMDMVETTNQLKTTASEFETLVAKDQASAETLFFLDVIYAKLGDTTKRQAVVDRQAKLAKQSFKVDTEVLAPEELAAIPGRTANPPITVVPGGAPGAGTVVQAGAPFGAGPTISVNDSVGPLPKKFAIVIGQSTSRLSGGLIPYADTDAKRVRDALVDFAGYPAANVVLLQNVTGADILAAAKTLAAGLDENSSVLIYYAGAGVNLAGKDYLAGRDTESAGDIGSMVSKTELFGTFTNRGARTFAFFEVNRPMDANGMYFGREIPRIGSIAQIQSTPPGETVRPIYRTGVPVGLFTNAFVISLANIRANQIPIWEFTWQVVNIMRRGDTGLDSGSTTQICTLPQLTALAADSKF